MRRLLTCVIMLGLTACQSPNPYKASVSPELSGLVPAVPARIDPGSYPAAPIDYSRYRSWAWSPEGVRASGNYAQSLNIANVQDAISAQLDQRGLRPTSSGTKPDLYVRANVRQEQRVTYDTDYYNGGVGYGGYPYGYDRWGTYGGTGYSQTRPRYYQVQVLSIDLIDAQSRKVIWSGSAEEHGNGDDQGARAKSVREAARRAMEQYPPH
jgi:hypothetical protein